MTMDTGLIIYVLDKAAQCEDTSLFLDWSVLDTHVLHVATSQCCIANFCDFFQSWYYPPSQYHFHLCVSAGDMTAVLALLLKVNLR